MTEYLFIDSWLDVVIMAAGYAPESGSAESFDKIYVYFSSLRILFRSVINSKEVADLIVAMRYI